MLGVYKRNFPMKDSTQSTLHSIYSYIYRFYTVLSCMYSCTRIHTFHISLNWGGTDSEKF